MTVIRMWIFSPSTVPKCFLFSVFLRLFIYLSYSFCHTALVTGKIPRAQFRISSVIMRFLGKGGGDSLLSHGFFMPPTKTVGHICRSILCPVIGH